MRIRKTPALFSWKALLAVILTGALGMMVLNPVEAQTNEAPDPEADTVTTAEDVAIDIDVLDNDSDPDGNTLTVAAVGLPSHGSAIINADETVKYTPSLNFNGTDSFTYAVTDGGIVETATVTVTVTPVNDAPTAMHDMLKTKQDTEKTINVLSNDSDVDESTTLVVVSASVPDHGTVSLGTGGELTYTPDEGYAGTDSFTYVVSDGSLQATGTVAVTVKAKDEPKPPVADFDAKVVEACAVTPAQPGVPALCSIYLSGTLPSWAQHYVGKNILKLSQPREEKPDRVTEACAEADSDAVARLCAVYASDDLPPFVKLRIGKLILMLEHGAVRGHSDVDHRWKDKGDKDRGDDKDEAKDSANQSIADHADKGDKDKSNKGGDAGHKDGKEKGRSGFKDGRGYHGAWGWGWGHKRGH